MSVTSSSATKYPCLNGSADLELNFCIVSGNFAGEAGGIFYASGTNLELNRGIIHRDVSADGEQIAEL